MGRLIGPIDGIGWNRLGRLFRPWGRLTHWPARVKMKKYTQTMKTSVLLLLTALCAPAAPADLDALIAAARSAPGEFSADALIRLASVDKLEKARRMELLDQAFQKAPSAQFPYKRHAAPMRQDGSVGYWNRVYSQ